MLQIPHFLPFVFWSNSYGAVAMHVCSYHIMRMKPFIWIINFHFEFLSSTALANCVIP